MMVRVGGKECFISVRVLTKIELCGWERDKGWESPHTVCGFLT